MAEPPPDPPQYIHDCVDCVFLGRWEVAAATDVELDPADAENMGQPWPGAGDVYYCPQTNRIHDPGPGVPPIMPVVNPGPTVVFRFGPDPLQYRSGISLRRRLKGEMRLRADEVFESVRPPSFNQSILADNPIGYWRLGDTSGLAVDQTGHANGAYVEGGVPSSVVAGLFGQPAATRLHNGGWVEVPRDPDFPDTFPGGFTVELLWRVEVLDPGDFGLNELFNLRYGQLEVAYSPPNHRFEFSSAGIASKYANVTVTPGTQYHVVVTYDPVAGLKFYLNGVRRDLGMSGLLGGYYPDSGDRSIVLGSPGVAYGSGETTISDGAVYDHPLSDAQVSAHHAQLLSESVRTSFNQSILADHPIGYWLLGDAAGPAVDRTGNVNGVYLDFSHPEWLDSPVTAERVAGMFGQPAATRFHRSVNDAAASSMRVPRDPSFPDTFVNGFTVECLWHLDAIEQAIPSVFNLRNGQVSVRANPTTQYAPTAFWCNLGGTTPAFVGLDTPVVVGEVYHIVFTHDPARGSDIYVNGAHAHADTKGVAVGNGTGSADASVQFGGEGDPDSGDGGGEHTLSDCAVYDYPLTAAQVSAHHAQLLSDSAK